MLVRHIPRPWETLGNEVFVRPLTDRRGGANTPDVAAGSNVGTPRGLLWAVALIALIGNAVNLAASQLWIYPDSIDYLQLADRLIHGFDLSDELYLVRTPAYPFLLAGVFKVLGPWSPEALLVLQHGMAVGVAVLASAIAWHLTRIRLAALLSGVFCALSLQVLSYANLVLTEAPFALVVTAHVFCLVRFLETGRRRCLAAASALCGVAYLFRPIGLGLVAPCVLAAWLSRAARMDGPRAPSESGGADHGRSSWGIGGAERSATRRASGAFAAVCVAIVPGVAVAAPWMVVSRALHQGSQPARCLDYVLYLRAASFDGLDSARSAALNDIKLALDEARARGAVPAGATYRDRPAVEHALRAVRGADFAQISAILGRAGRDLMREHPWPTFVNTFRYAAWMVLDADPVYRFVPGGEPGCGGGRARDASLFDIGTYSVGEGSWEKRLSHFTADLPLDTAPRAATPIWSALVRKVHSWLGTSSGPGSTFRSPFALLMVLCMASGATMLLGSRRRSWGVLLSVILVHVLTSAFLGGPLTRYAVAVKPLILVCGAAGLAGGVGLAIRGARRIVGAPFGFAVETTRGPSQVGFRV